MDMSEDYHKQFLKSYCNYALILRLPYYQIADLQQTLEMMGIMVLYDKPSLHYLRVIESPSGIADDSDTE